MNTKDDALKLALEALEENHHLIEEYERPEYLAMYDRVISAVAKALAEESSGAEQPKLSDYEPDGMHHNKPHKCKYPKCDYPCPDLPDCRDAEQPAQQQEPVAWITQNGKGWLRWHKPEDNNTDSVPLYTSPPASKPWVGLTDEEIAEIEDEYIVDYRIPAGCGWNFAKDIEAKLRGKNQ